MGRMRWCEVDWDYLMTMENMLQVVCAHNGWARKSLNTRLMRRDIEKCDSRPEGDALMKFLYAAALRQIVEGG